MSTQTQTSSSSSRPRNWHTRSGGEHTYDTVIVGTGIGGLTAGLTLARAGHSVLLLEAGKQFGGMLNPFMRRKFHFDVGVHYVGEAGPGQGMRRMLDALELDIDFREINPDCIDRYVFGDYEARLVKGLERWIEVLVADFPHQASNLRRFADFMKACKALLATFQGRPSLARTRQMARHPTRLLRVLRQPFSQLLAAFFDDPLLRAVFAGPGGDIGVPPSRASALVSVAVLLHFLEGGYYPVGGSGAIRDAYVDQLKHHGAEMLRNRLVSDIEVRGDHDFVVHTQRGEAFHARSVVSNADIKQTLDMVSGAQPHWLVRRKMRNLRPSLGAFCLFIGTDLELSDYGITDANIWHYGTPDIEAGYAPAFRDEMPTQPFFFLTAPTLKDPETVRAPEGHHTLELITFVPNAPFRRWFDAPLKRRGEDYEALKADLTEKLLTGAEHYVPDLRDHIVVQEASTPATVWHFVRGQDGGIYGPEHSPSQSVPWRFLPQIGIPGLYLAGASVFGAGIHTCLSSGMVAAQVTQHHLRKAHSGWRARIGLG